MDIQQVSASRSFDGEQRVYAHVSAATRCTMRFGLYLPPQARRGRVPVLYWLSGLTCTEDNFIVKAGAQRAAAELGLALAADELRTRQDLGPRDFADRRDQSVDHPGEDAMRSST